MVDSRLQPCPKVMILWASPLSPQGSSPWSSKLSHPQRLSNTPFLFTRGSARSDSASAIPSGFYKAPAGPFGKRISFFLDAFPDLGATEGLCAGSHCSLAWEGGAGGPDPPEHCSPGPFRSNPQLPPRVCLTVFFCAADPVGDGLFKEGKSPSWGPLSPAVQKGEPAGASG